MSALFLKLIASIAIPSAVLLLLALYQRSWKSAKGAIVFAGAAFLLGILVIFPNLVGIPRGGLTWNWLGKILSIAGSIALISGISWLTIERVGLRLPKERKVWYYTILVGALYVIPFVVLWMLTSERPSQDWLTLETFLFQLTMPSIAEELSDRGVLLAILHYFLPPQWKVRGVRFGWGSLLVALYFVLQHTLSYDPEGVGLYWGWDAGNTTMIIVASILLGTLREATSSIWPCVVCHSLFNLGVPVAMILIGH